jgi:hypothetical protein
VVFSLLLVFPGAQSQKSYSACKSRFPEAGMWRVGSAVLERSLLKKALPEKSSLKEVESGNVSVAVLIDSNGSVVCVAALNGPVELIEPSVKAAKSWKFRPYKLHGRPLTVEGVIHFHYQNGVVTAGFR